MAASSRDNGKVKSPGTRLRRCVECDTVVFILVPESPLQKPTRGEASVQACMSSGPVTQEQFELLLSRVNEQAAELATLRLRVAALERARDSDFEVISAAPSEPPPAPAATTPLVLSSSGISEERREVARGIGRWLKRCVEGELRGPSGRDQINLPSKLYLVVRDIHQKSYNPPLIFFTWAEAKALCVLRGQPSDSIFRFIGLPSKEEAREVPECPESLGLRDSFVFSGEQINFEYRVGALQLEADSAVCSIIAVTEVDGAVLVAVPEALWDRQKAKRILPVDALRKAVRVLVPGCIDEDRTTPEREPSFKVWLGILKESFEAAVHYDVEEVDVMHAFPVDALGVPKYPFARALVAIAKDHFDFVTAEEGSHSGGASGWERRMQSMETVLRELQEGMVGLRSQQAATRLTVALLPPTPKVHGGAGRAAASQPRLSVPGIDPGLARQALQSGVTPEALGEFAHMLGGAQLGRSPPVPHTQQQRSAEPEEEDLDGEPLEDVGLGATGSANPVEQALLQLTKIVSKMDRDQTVKTDKTLEALLDRAESGGAVAKDSLTSQGKSKSAALRSLRKMVVQQPEMIYQALERRMEEDWLQSGVPPGVASSSITARGWLEHRSKIQNFQVPVRCAWALAGVWDALRQGKVPEARARCALGVAALDQLGIDRGSWLVASEMTLEEPPPFSAFAAHRPLETWETPCSKLVDERWLELFLAKLRDIHDFQDKKQKLTASSRKVEDPASVKEKDAEKDSKKKKNQKGGAKGAGRGGEEEKTPPPA
eukprot:s3412_g3.t1